MIKKFALVSLVASALIIGSCHKSNSGGGGNSGQLVGNYKFLYLTAQTQSITQQSAAGQTAKTVTNTNYTTTQNTGTVTFTKDSAMTKGFGYTANTNAMAYVYQNGVLADSISMPYSVTIPATSSSSKYNVIGTDSIYFQGGFISAGGSSSASIPSGGRFKFKGDTLIMTESVTQTQAPVTSGGVTVSSSASVLATVYLLKQ